jgi:undecaprenyl-diphosphatase
MPDGIAVLLLGVIEGVTEFLPVSSTGHLLLAENLHWLPQQSELFNTVIQCGAVLAVLLVFWKRAGELLRGWREPAAHNDLLKLVVAFAITAAGGLVVKKFGWTLTKESAPVAWATLIGGILFIVVEAWLRGKPRRDEVSWTTAIAVGAAQLLAGIFPGASRSGTTILVALLFGVSRPAATEFSFLLGIPTLLATGAFEVLSAFRHGTAAAENWGHVALAAAVAAVTAFVVVKWLLRYVQTHTFVAFGWYRIALGAAILIWAR